LTRRRFVFTLAFVFNLLVNIDLMTSDHLSATFAALADPRGARSSRASASGETSGARAGRAFDISLPPLRHLKVLERAGLIERGEGQWRPAGCRPTRSRHCRLVEHYRAPLGGKLRQAGALPSRRLQRKNKVQDIQRKEKRDGRKKYLAAKNAPLVVERTFDALWRSSGRRSPTGRHKQWSSTSVNRCGSRFRVSVSTSNTKVSSKFPPLQGHQSDPVLSGRVYVAVRRPRGDSLVTCRPVRQGRRRG